MFRNKKTILSAVIVLFLITVVLGARIRKPLATKRTEAATTTSRQSAALATTKHGPVQVVRFTLYDAGIYPLECKRWTCRRCGAKKVRRVAGQLAAGMRLGRFCRRHRPVAPAIAFSAARNDLAFR